MSSARYKNNQPRYIHKFYSNCDSPKQWFNNESHNSTEHIDLLPSSRSSLTTHSYALKPFLYRLTNIAVVVVVVCRGFAKNIYLILWYFFGNLIHLEKEFNIFVIRCVGSNSNAGHHPSATARLEKSWEKCWS